MDSILLDYKSHRAQRYEIVLTTGHVFTVSVQPGDTLRRKLQVLLAKGEEIRTITKDAN